MSHEWMTHGTSQLNDMFWDAMADCQDFEIWLNALGQFARHLLWRMF